MSVPGGLQQRDLGSRSSDTAREAEAVLGAENPYQNGSWGDPERRAEGQARGRATRSANAARLRSDVLHDGLKPFAAEDRAEWDRLATLYGLRLPPYGVPVTTAGIRRYLERLGIAAGDYIDWHGAGSDGNVASARISDFIARNPTWPLKAWVGLALEAVDAGQLRRFG